MASVNPLKRKAPDFSEPTITILVGPTRKIFTLHPSILVSGSKFFRSALSGQWKESTKNRIVLPETSPKVFQSYAHYVYKGEIDICAEPLDEASDPEARERFCLLAELYALADIILDDKSLRNAVVDAVLDLEGKTGHQPSFEAIQYAYDHSSGTNPLCRLLLDNALAATHPDWLRSVWNELPDIYLQALVYGWAKASFDKTITYQSSAERPRCQYHEHDAEVLVGDACAVAEEAAVTKALTPKAKKRFVRSRA